MRQTTVLTALVLLLLPFSANAGELAVGGVSFKGTTVNVPILLKGDVGTGVAAMDFTFTYDPAVFEPLGVTAGEAASAADKGVQYNLLEPGRCKVVMMGLNQSVVPSGEVAMLRLRRLTESGGATELAINDPTFSDPNASAIPSKGTTETIELTGDTATPEEPEPNPDETPGQDGDTENPDDPDATPESPEVAPPGTVVPTTPDGDGTTAPAGGVAGSMPVGVKPGLSGNPKDPALANRLKRMARIGDASQLPRGIQPGAPEAPLGAADASAGAVNLPPGARPGGAVTPTGMPGSVSEKSPAAAAGALAMNTLGAPGQPPLPTGKNGATAASTPPGNPVSVLNPRWIGVAIIVVAMGILFALRRRLFS
ncbi:MAG: cohesin domain-containing protein [FCB group bacterium]|jgi:hypothetical protein|nr:cohesin domain-containing protein [FCB group bacterium]